MGLIDRTSIANVVAGVVVILAVAYSTMYNNADLLRTLALVAAGYLFGKGGGGAAKTS